MNKFQNNKFILPEEEDKLSRRIHPMPDYLAKLLQIINWNISIELDQRIKKMIMLAGLREQN